jgi:hypothetical protein
LKKDVIDRYLDRYAEPEAIEVSTGDATTRYGRYADALVVPVFDEPAEALWWIVPPAVDDLLLIAVVNAPLESPDEDARKRTLDCLRTLGGCADRGSTLVEPLIPLRPGVDLLVIDRASRARIPNRQGVGLARKIGADVALMLIQAGVVRRQRIHTTDADAVLPEAYFESDHRSDALGWAFPFRHWGADPAVHRAGQLYEAHMRWYRAGLAAAGSRYAHHSLGSAIGVSARGYAMVRGFPKRAAGEDFYFLNKLAKLGPISVPELPAIRVEARPSTRTPFGTGPALAAFPADPERYLTFNPVAFEFLRTALQRLHNDGAAADDAVGLALGKLGASRALARIQRQAHSVERRHQAIDDWFDGLRTLRFLHEIRDLTAPDTPLLSELRSAGLLTHAPELGNRALDEMNDAWCLRERDSVDARH